MRKIKNVFSILVFLNIVVCIYFLLSQSLAFEYDNNQYTLFYKEDNWELANDIKKYLQDIDKILITNTEFESADILVENYDYMVNFALDYVREHKEYYCEKIKDIDEYQYKDDKNQLKITNQYIDVETIYEITDKYFGIRDFKILNQNVKIVDDYISLIDNNDDTFIDKIKDIKIENKEDKINVYATYYYGTYQYIFYKKNNVLKIYNVEVRA